MPSYAVLGGTGATGSAVIRVLLRDPENHINIYVRSKSKLERLIPGILEHPQIKIFEGDMFDVKLIASCLRGTKSVFQTLATNANQPGLRIAQQAAHVIVAAMMQIKLADTDAKLPQILILSSATLNPLAKQKIPFLIWWITHTAFFNIYLDLELAREYLELHKDWLDVTFIQPAGLAEGPEVGHEFSPDDCGMTISYADLGAGMVEVAESSLYKWQSVCVKSPKGKDPRKGGIPLILLTGLSSTFFPPLFKLWNILGWNG